MMNSAAARLEQFLSARFPDSRIEIEQLTPDASVRDYFRVNWADGRAIACVYPEKFVASEQNYLDVTNLFLVSSLPVAEILDYEESSGIIILEDFGDTILRDVLLAAENETREKLLDEAIILIARIQAATARAFAVNSIASRLKFDQEKLLWELNFFREHYFTSHKKRPLDAPINEKLTAEFAEIARELEAKAEVLCHRDFHAANLMLDRAGNLRIIDHQDARIGTASYDLASLLLDRVTELPPEDRVREKCAFFLAEREKLGLAAIDAKVFAQEFKLQSIQRCLKACGTFSYQSTFRAKTHFIPFIKPMFQIALQSAENLNRFPVLQSILDQEIKA